jgi:hypothetical protein
MNGLFSQMTSLARTEKNVDLKSTAPVNSENSTEYRDTGKREADLDQKGRGNGEPFKAARGWGRTCPAGRGARFVTLVSHNSHVARFLLLHGVCHSKSAKSARKTNVSGSCRYSQGVSLGPGVRGMPTAS